MTRDEHGKLLLSGSHAEGEKAREKREATQTFGNGIKTRHLPGYQKAREAKTRDLRELVSMNAERILNSISDEDIEGAKLKEKIISAAVLIDKFQVMKGEPTQIIGIEDRQKMPEILAAIAREMTRRGLTIEQDPVNLETRVIPAEVVR